MPSIYKSKIENYSVEQMFALVNDVEAYPEYLPWCKKVTILRKQDNEVDVQVEIAKGPLNRAFTTKNSIIENVSIEMKLLNGPFKYLEGKWTFKSLSETQCKITFELNFALSIGPFSNMLNPIFENLYSSLIRAFSDRAQFLYKNT